VTPPPAGISYWNDYWYAGGYDSWYGNGWGYEGYYGWYTPFLFGMPYYSSPMPYGLGGGSGGGSSTPSYARPAPGAMKLKVTPKDAEVYVDMKYMGRVNEFDGARQSLPMDAGTHAIEIRREGYDTVRFEVRIMPGRTVTYQGALRPAGRT
jgi:hypothetical protein